jgi:hypothetical protein
MTLCLQQIWHPKLTYNSRDVQGRVQPCIAQQA